MSTTRADKKAEWVDLLQQSAERNATVGLARAGADCDWRLRLLAIDEHDETLIIEHPPIGREGSSLRPHQELDVQLFQAQSRWVLRCTLIERFRYALREDLAIPAARLSWPRKAERLQRRSHFRAPAIGPDCPQLRLWILEDAASAAKAEEALELAWRNRHTRSRHPALPRPSVGREINVVPVDLSGGGMRLIMPTDMQATLDRDPLFWLELSLPTEPLPVHVAARVAHWHQEEGALHVGVAFTFTHHPRYASFVADRLTPTVVALQREELKRHRA